MSNELMYRNNTGLTMQDLKRVAPAIFARSARSDRSERYAFIPTHDVVSALMRTGLLPVEVRSKRKLDPEDRGFAKHALRFRVPTMTTRQVGDVIPEILLTNSHDGGSAYQLMMGFFRLVCSNGLVVQTGSMGFISVKHVGRDTPEEVVGRSRELIRALPQSLEEVKEMRSVRLEQAEQRAFARAAMSLRWDPNERREEVQQHAKEAEANGDRRSMLRISQLTALDAPISVDKLLEARRFDDNGADVWSTFNRVQENLTKGGQNGLTAAARRLRVQPIKGMDKDIKLNRALWVLARELAAHKSGRKALEVGQ